MNERTQPWAPGTATGVGSLPHDDIDEACRVVAGELPDFVHLPELPGRGAGADMVGRAAGLLVDLHVDLQPSGWRLVDRPGGDEARAVDLLRQDLDAFQVAAHGYQGPAKVQVAGPWTLASALDRGRGGPVLADPGACRDLAQSLAEGIVAHVADVARRLPGARFVLQLDEPSLPAVLAGTIPTASGFGRLRMAEAAEVESHLATALGAVRSAGALPVVHCCAGDVPATLVAQAGAVALSLDPTRLTESALGDLAAAVDGGLELWPGVVPSTDPPGQPPSDSDLARGVLALWKRLDQGPGAAAGRTVVTLACGLASASPRWAVQAYGLARATARAVLEAAAD